MRRALLFAVTIMLPAPAAPLAAQGGPGFLFREPRLSVGLLTGYSVPRAGSDLFDLAREQLTVSTFDFSSPAVGADIAVRLGERWDAGVEVLYSQSVIPSEFRDWVDLDDNPIEQETSFRRVSVALTGKYYLSDRGRSIGRFAWVPARLTPFVGASVGMVDYRFEQTGDFVDFETLDIFFERFISGGQATMVQLLGGADLSVGRQFFVTGKAQYRLASAPLDSDFEGFEEIDLAGLQLLIGISLRF